jgi:hypothetical protein
MNHLPSVDSTVAWFDAMCQGFDVLVGNGTDSSEDPIGADGYFRYFTESERLTCEFHTAIGADGKQYDTAWVELVHQVVGRYDTNERKSIVTMCLVTKESWDAKSVFLYKTIVVPDSFVPGLIEYPQ